MINLNKKKLTKDLVLSEVDDYNIFRYYCGEFKIGKPFLSKLRQEKKPSFSIFVHHSKQLFFNDFLLGTGDFVKFIQLKFNLRYYDALSKVAHDFKFNDKYICNPLKPIILKKSTNNKFKKADKDEIVNNIKTLRLRKRNRRWKMLDHKYWRQYNISHPTLVKFNVEPIDYVFINDKIIKTDKHCYCFTERKDGIETYKIYQPYNEEFKWINNHDYSVWQGWTQLPHTGDHLIITKSLKDVMCLYETCNIPAISLQGESVTPKNIIINDLKKRFKYIYILYDNDYDSKVNWGRQFASKLANDLMIPMMEIDSKFKSKDFSDFIKNHNKKLAIKELLSMMEVHQIPF